MLRKIKDFLWRTVPFLLLTPFYAILGVFLYWAILSQIPPETITLIDYNPKILAAGDDITIRYKSIWHRDCTYHVSRSLVNASSALVIGYGEYVSTKGHPEQFNSTFKLPVSVDDGKYTMIIQAQPVCNLYDYLLPRQMNIARIPVTIDNTPVILKSLEILNPKMKVGEGIQVEATTEKRRFCGTTVDTFIVAADDSIAWRTSRPSAAVTLGPQVIKETLFPVPELKPGKYILRRAVRSECLDVKVFQYSYPDVQFEVIP